jgi:hypothetical protein
MFDNKMMIDYMDKLMENLDRLVFEDYNNNYSSLVFVEVDNNIEEEDDMGDNT